MIPSKEYAVMLPVSESDPVICWFPINKFDPVVANEPVGIVPNVIGVPNPFAKSVPSV